MDRDMHQIRWYGHIIEVSCVWITFWSGELPMNRVPKIKVEMDFFDVFFQNKVDISSLHISTYTHKHLGTE